MSIVPECGTKGVARLGCAQVGNLQSVTLSQPKGLALPDNLDVYVILDVFPVLQKAIR